MSFATSVYNTIFKRNSVFVATIFGGSFFYDLAFHNTFDKIWDSMNAGKQWKDIKHKYVQDSDDE